MYHILLFIVYGMTSVQSDGIRNQTVYKEADVLEGYNITSSILDDVSKYERLTPVACGIQCSTLENCLSFFYNSVTKQCQFHTEVFLANTGASTQAGTLYFYHLGEEPTMIASTDSGATTTTATTTAASTATATTTTTTTPNPCPTADGFEMSVSVMGEMCVKYHTDLKNWFDANATCANYSTNSQLAVVDTAVKNELVIMAGVPLNPKMIESVFFGLTSDGWVDGSPLVFTSWHRDIVPGPNQCVTYQRFLSWEWKGVGCNLQKHFVCQIPL